MLGIGSVKAGNGRAAAGIGGTFQELGPGVLQAEIAQIQGGIVDDKQEPIGTEIEPDHEVIGNVRHIVPGRARRLLAELAHTFFAKEHAATAVKIQVDAAHQLLGKFRLLKRPRQGFGVGLSSGRKNKAHVIRLPVLRTEFGGKIVIYAAGKDCESHQHNEYPLTHLSTPVAIHSYE